MKTRILLFILLAISITNMSAQVKVGNNPNTINGCSVLELESNNKGILIPRLLQAERIAIASPVKGLMVYQTDGSEGFYYYTGSAWTTLASGFGTQWSTNGTNVYYNGGNVGIGTSTPSTFFNVLSASSTTGGICMAKFEGTQHAGSINNVNIQLVNNSVTNSKTFMLMGGTGNFWAVGNDLSGNHAQNFYIYDLNTFTTRFFIDNVGNTGIGSVTPNSLLHVSGSISLPVTTKITDYTATISDYTILCNIGAMTISLPSAVGIDGRMYVIKKTSALAGTINIDPNGTETIDGSLTNGSITTQHQSMIIQSDGTNWVILSNN